MTPDSHASLPDLDLNPTLPSSAGPLTPMAQADGSSTPVTTWEGVTAKDARQTAEQSDRLNKLAGLLQRSTVYSRILATSMADERAKAEAATKRAKTKQSKQAAKGASAATGTGPAGPGKKRKADDDGLETAEKKSKVAPAPPPEDAEWEAPVMETQSKLVTGATLRDYQLAGAQWLDTLSQNGFSGIIGDEMGLGKTLQTIAFLAWLWENQVYGPYLIVVPLSVLDNWISEFARFTPTIPTLRYYGADRVGLRKFIRLGADGRATAETPIVLTTYQIVINDRSFLSKFRYKWLVVDEAHRLKNMQSRLIRELKMFTSEHRLLLTGTPLQNNLVELFSLLSFVLPDIFTDVDLFKNLFDFEGTDGLGANTAAKASFIAAQLHDILKPFMLRRMKKDVEVNLPLKKEYVLYAPMTGEQKKLTDYVLDGRIRELLISRSTAAPGEVATVPEPEPEVIEPGTISERIANKKGGRKSIRKDYSEVLDDEYFEKIENEDPNADLNSAMEVGLAHAKRVATTRVNNMTLQNACMQLRKASLHPFLFDAELEWDGFDKRLLESSGKMLLLDRLLGELFVRGHKVLIFSQFTKMLDIIHDWAVDQKRWDLCRIDGSTKVDERRELMNKFNAPDGTCRLFLLSTRAGGVGINLVAADTVIFYDSDWNPQQDLQAMDRAHRIGQTKPVLVFRLVTENSIEGKILERAGNKRKLEKLVIGNGRFDGDYRDVNDLFSGTKRKDRTALEVEFAEQLANEQDQQVFLAEAGDEIISDEQLNVLLDRSDEVMNSKETWKGDGKTATFAVMATEALGDEEDELAGLFGAEEEKNVVDDEDSLTRVNTAAGTPAFGTPLTGTPAPE
ncbi:hypothetical protein T439DRAFT_326425 [Meredithblackwellia eburnea MCA 4105]